MNFFGKRALGLSVLLLAVVLDQISKDFMLRATLDMPYELLTPILSLTLAWNPGMSFSFLADFAYSRELLSTIAIIAAIVFVVWMRQDDAPRPHLHQIALGLLTGGAIGNVIDRFNHGAVVDFFHFHWYDTTLFIFNGADAFISIGVVLLFLENMFTKKREPHV